MSSPELPRDDDAGGAAAAAAHVTPWRLFVAFSQLATIGFGGVMPFAYRALVERHRWLSSTEFAQLVALAQILPGPTICNLAVMIGHRHAGTRGGVAALLGMVTIPAAIVSALAVGHRYFGDVAVVRDALRGMSAAAAGLILATAVKIAKGLPRNVAPWVLVAMAFVGIGVLRYPLIAVTLVLAPLAVASAYFGERR